MEGMSMKKTIRRFAAFLMVFALLLCGLGTEARAASTDYKFKYKGVTAKMNGKAKKLIKKMGDVEPSKTKSCVYDGDDYVYDGKDLVLCTYTNKKGGKQYIQSVSFKTTKIKTAEGIKLGSKESKVKEKYGEDAEPSYGIYTFTKGKTVLSITVKEGKVTGIEYIAAI